ncbi:Phoxous domain [Trinorchestia longiramus]|nr:Phoxous domain [Trinorchestia longiramus]
MNNDTKKDLLWKELLGSVKACQVKYSSKQELATEGDPRVCSVCSSVEQILCHGVKLGTVQASSSPASAIRQMTEYVSSGLQINFGGNGGVESSRGEPLPQGAAWTFISSHLTAHEASRFLRLRHVSCPAGRLRAWIRSALNEHSVERYFRILQRPSLCRNYYKVGGLSGVGSAVEWVQQWSEFSSGVGSAVEWVQQWSGFSSGVGSAESREGSVKWVQQSGLTVPKTTLPLWLGCATRLGKIFFALIIDKAGVCGDLQCCEQVSSDLPDTCSRAAAQLVAALPRSKSHDKGLSAVVHRRQLRRRKRKVPSQLVSFDEDPTSRPVGSPSSAGRGAASSEDSLDRRDSPLWIQSAPTTCLNSPALTGPSDTPYADTINRLMSVNADSRSSGDSSSGTGDKNAVGDVNNGDEVNRDVNPSGKANGDINMSGKVTENVNKIGNINGDINMSCKANESWVGDVSASGKGSKAAAAAARAVSSFVGGRGVAVSASTDVPSEGGGINTPYTGVDVAVDARSLLDNVVSSASCVGKPCMSDSTETNVSSPRKINGTNDLEEKQNSFQCLDNLKDKKQGGTSPVVAISTHNPRAGTDVTSQSRSHVSVCVSSESISCVNYVDSVPVVGDRAMLEHDEDGVHRLHNGEDMTSESTADGAIPCSESTVSSGGHAMDMCSNSEATTRSSKRDFYATGSLDEVLSAQSVDEIKRSLTCDNSSDNSVNIAEPSAESQYPGNTDNFTVALLTNYGNSSSVEDVQLKREMFSAVHNNALANKQLQGISNLSSISGQNLKSLPVKVEKSFTGRVSICDEVSLNPFPLKNYSREHAPSVFRKDEAPTSLDGPSLSISSRGVMSQVSEAGEAFSADETGGLTGLDEVSSVQADHSCLPDVVVVKGPSNTDNYLDSTTVDSTNLFPDRPGKNVNPFPGSTLDGTCTEGENRPSYSHSVSQDSERGGGSYNDVLQELLNAYFPSPRSGIASSFSIAPCTLTESPLKVAHAEPINSTASCCTSRALTSTSGEVSSSGGCGELVADARVCDSCNSGSSDGAFREDISTCFCADLNLKLAGLPVNSDHYTAEDSFDSASCKAENSDQSCNVSSASPTNLRKRNEQENLIQNKMKRQDQRIKTQGTRKECTRLCGLVPSQENVKFSSPYDCSAVCSCSPSMCSVSTPSASPLTSSSSSNKKFSCFMVLPRNMPVSTNLSLTSANTPAYATASVSLSLTTSTLTATQRSTNTSLTLTVTSASSPAASMVTGRPSVTLRKATSGIAISSGRSDGSGSDLDLGSYKSSLSNLSDGSAFSSDAEAGASGPVDAPVNISFLEDPGGTPTFHRPRAALDGSAPASNDYAQAPDGVAPAPDDTASTLNNFAPGRVLSTSTLSVEELRSALHTLTECRELTETRRRAAEARAETACAENEVLRRQLDMEKRRAQTRAGEAAAKEDALKKENELLRKQLGKYISAVQLLKHKPATSAVVTAADTRDPVPMTVTSTAAPMTAAVSVTQSTVVATSHSVASKDLTQSDTNTICNKDILASAASELLTLPDGPPLSVQLRPRVVLPPPPKYRDYHREAEAYEAKLIQVAEMHGELFEFSERLQRVIRVREAQIASLRRELISLRGPLPDDASLEVHLQQMQQHHHHHQQHSSDETDTVDTASLCSTEVGTPSALPRPLINVWIPTAFLVNSSGPLASAGPGSAGGSVGTGGKSSDQHHVYQVYVRIGDDEWTVYRRFAHFHELQRRLQRNYPAVRRLPFPSKKPFGYKEESVVSARRVQLQEFLRHVVNILLTSCPQLAACPDRASLVAVLPFLAENCGSVTVAAASRPPPQYSGL